MLLGSGLEAIAFQRTRPLFHLLTAEFKKLMADYVENKSTVLTSEMLSKSNLPAILQAGSGFKKVTLVSDVTAPINAYTSSISLSSNHVFLREWQRAYAGNADALNLFRRLDDVLKGTIDLDTGMVGGAFAEIPIVIGLGCQMFNPAHGFTPEEMAACFLHELGHDFTWCYAIHYTCTSNMVLATAVNALVAEKDTKQKHAIMADIENRLGIKITNQDELFNYDKYENYYVTLSGAYRAKIYAALGSNSYDNTMSEQMADMFAARHGAGKHIISLLYRMDKLWKRPSVFKSFVTNLLTYTVFSPFAIPMYIYSVMTNDFIAGTYDLDKDRFIRVRNESIASLKDPALTSDEKKLILSEIEKMNEMIDDTSNAWSLAEKLARLVRRDQREQFRNKRFQQELEALVNNPLYVSAAKYSV